MSGKNGGTFYCAPCDMKFINVKDYESHCGGKKHKVNERMRGERDAAASSVVVKGLRGCKDVEQSVALYFCQFGSLARVSMIGPVINGICRVQYHDISSVRRVLRAGAVHHHLGMRWNVTQFEYKPHQGDAARLAHKEEVRKSKAKNSKLHSQVMELIKDGESVDSQMEVLSRRLQLTEQDLKDRQGIANNLREIFAETHPGCQVHQFGSSINGFGMRDCDLDLYLHINGADDNATKQMKALAKILSGRVHTKTFADVLVIPSARCPIIKFTHKPTGLKCDLSLDNKKALHNSKLLKLYSSYPALRQLVFTLRLWAKLRGLSGQSGGSAPSHLSSYALSLLAIFYLSKINQVPNVARIEDAVIGTKAEVIDDCRCLIFPDKAQLPNPKKPLSAGQMLQGFFKFYSEEIDWESDALLTRNAKLIPRATLAQHFTYLNCRVGSMTVVDPYNLKHNVAANVSEAFRHRFEAELRRAAKLSATWTPSTCMEKNTNKQRGLFELLQEPENKLEENKKTKKSLKGGKSTSPSGNSCKTATRLEGEQENGEFHIILPVSFITLRNSETVKASQEIGVSSSQQWLIWARDFTVNTLESVFYAEIKDRMPEEEEEVKAKSDTKEEEKSGVNDIEMRNGGEGKCAETEIVQENIDDKRERIVKLREDMIARMREEMKMIKEQNMDVWNEMLELGPEIASNKRSNGDHYLDTGLLPSDTSGHSDESTDIEGLPMKKVCDDASRADLHSPISPLTPSAVPTVMDHGVSGMPTTSLTTATTATTSTVTSTLVSPPIVLSSTYSPSYSTPIRKTSLESFKSPDSAQPLVSSTLSSTLNFNDALSSSNTELSSSNFDDTSDSNVNMTDPDNNLNSDNIPGGNSSNSTSEVHEQDKCVDETGSISKSSNTIITSDEFTTVTNQTGSCNPVDIDKMDVTIPDNQDLTIPNNENLTNPDKQNLTSIDSNDTTKSFIIDIATPKEKETTTSFINGELSSNENDKSSSKNESMIKDNSNIFNHEKGCDSDPPAANSSKIDPAKGLMSNRYLRCFCRKQVWLGRKKVRRELVLQAHPTAVCGSGLILEREISDKVIEEREGVASGARQCTDPSQSLGTLGARKRTATENESCSSHTSDVSAGTGEFLLEFTCDLVLNDAEVPTDEEDNDDCTPSPFLLIKLKPTERCRGTFKVFYDLFRSTILRLNACDLNTSQ